MQDLDNLMIDPANKEVVEKEKKYRQPSNPYASSIQRCF